MTLYFNTRVSWKKTNDINEIKESFNVSFIPCIEGKPPFDYI